VGQTSGGALVRKFERALVLAIERAIECPPDSNAHFRPMCSTDRLLEGARESRGSGPGASPAQVAENDYKARRVTTTDWIRNSLVVAGRFSCPGKCVGRVGPLALIVPLNDVLQAPQFFG
jgi:hypothetical protein